MFCIRSMRCKVWMTLVPQKQKELCTSGVSQQLWERNCHVCVSTTGRCMITAPRIHQRLTWAIEWIEWESGMPRYAASQIWYHNITYHNDIMISQYRQRVEQNGRIWAAFLLPGLTSHTLKRVPLNQEGYVIYWYVWWYANISVVKADTVGGRWPQNPTRWRSL